VNTFLEVRTATIVSLAAKKEISHLAPKRILRASKSFSTSLLQTLGVILLFVLLLQLLAPWPSRPSFQNHTWEKTFPSSTSHLEKTTYAYDAASGSSLYCNGDPVNGLDPDGRCVEGMVTGQSYNTPSYAGALMGRMNPFFSTTQQLYSTAQTYNANYETFGESHWNAINTTFNPAYPMVKGGYEAYTGFGVSPNNLGQDLSMGQRISSGAESVLGAAGTFGIAFGIPEVMGGVTAGPRVFWSGGSATREAAEVFAKANGGVTLEMTLPGKVLDKLTTKQTYPYLKPLWNSASINFAKGAGESADVFQSSSRGVRVESIWATQEYPQLMKQNTEINFHMIP